MITLNELKYLPPDHDEFPELLLSPGDVLFNRTNSAELVGKTAVYRGESAGAPRPCAFASYLLRMRLVTVLPELVAYFINSAFGRAWIAGQVTQRVGQANVNASKLRTLAVPLPPQVEQTELVRHVQKTVENLNVLGSRLSQAGSELGELDDALLAKAFSGELVDQDPGDEPASVLVDRLRQEQTKAPKSMKRRAPRRRKGKQIA